MTDTIATADAITERPIVGIATITGFRSDAIAMTTASEIAEIAETNEPPVAAIATTTRTSENQGTVVRTDTPVRSGGRGDSSCCSPRFSCRPALAPS